MMMKAARTAFALTLFAASGALMSLTATAVWAQTGTISSKESALAAAGFQARTADTPERQEMLARLPAKKILLRTYQGVTHYVYADPKGCNCIYVGDDAAFQAYTKAQRQQANLDERELTAQTFADDRWNWGAWGGFGPGFGWGRSW